MSERSDDVVPKLQVSNFQVKAYEEGFSSFVHSPSGRYTYLYPEAVRMELTVFDTWTKTKIRLRSTTTISDIVRLHEERPCFIDDFTIVQLFSHGGSTTCDDLVIKVDLEKQTFEVQPLGVRSVYEPVGTTFAIAVESDWLLFASETVEQVCQMFWFNMKTMELKPFRSISLFFRQTSSNNIYYNNQKLYMVYVDEKKIQRYDLALHLPWLSTFEVVEVPTCEIKMESCLKATQWLNEWCSTKQDDKQISYSIDLQQLSILDLNTGLVKCFKLLSSDVWCPSACWHLAPFFVFDGNFLTIHSKMGQCCENTESQIELVTTRFVLRKPQSLFDLAWFRRPRDFRAPDFMKQLL